MIKPYNSNIEKETLNNKYYRKVLFTGEHMQLVVMSLKVGEDIPLEVHPNVDQFIRIESGEASIEIGEEKFSLKEDDAVIVPAGKKHYVKNTSETENLKLYTIYSPPNHTKGTIHKTKQEADSAEHGH